MDRNETSELLRQLLADDLEQHLTYEQLEELVDGRLSPGSATARAHVARCAVCRADLAHLRGIAAEVGGSRTWRLPWWPLAAAAAIAATLLVVVALRTGTGGATAPADRVAARTASPDRSASRTPSTPALVDRLQDGSRAITIAADGTVGGLDDVPAGLRDAVARAIVAGRLETEPGVAEVIGSAGALLGSRGSVSPTVVQAPVGTAVETGRPGFRWTATPGAEYQVSVFDSGYNAVLESGWLTTTQWTPAVALKHGQRYSWQVRVRSGGNEITVPAPPAPEARFRVIDDADAQALQQLQARDPDAHLLAGIASARLGLFDAAERELTAAAAQNPSSSRAQQLAADLARVRRP